MSEIFENERERLAALQAVDRRLKEKRDEIALLSGEINAFNESLNRERGNVLRLTAEHAALDAQRSELHARLEGEEAKIKGSRMRMARVRNERELLALKHEVSVAKEANQLLEEQVIGMMERLDELARQIAAAQQAADEISARAEEETGGRQARIDAREAEIAAESGRREALAAGLSGALRSKYEQLFARRGGMAVVEVRNGICLGCRMHVPPQLANELQKTNDVRQCPNCQRILYWRPEGATASVES